MSEDRKEIAGIPCPVCRKQAAWRDNPFRPFCSERCRLIDLGKWATGDYRVAGEDVPPSEAGADGKTVPEK